MEDFRNKIPLYFAWVGNIITFLAATGFLCFCINGMTFSEIKFDIDLAILTLIIMYPFAAAWNSFKWFSLVNKDLSNCWNFIYFWFGCIPWLILLIFFVIISMGNLGSIST